MRLPASDLGTSRDFANESLAEECRININFVMVVTRLGIGVEFLRDRIAHLNWERKDATIHLGIVYPCGEITDSTHRMSHKRPAMAGAS